MRTEIDYNKLSKGDVIPPQELERITGYKSSSPSYAMAMLGVKSEIEKKTRFTCRIDGKTVRILTDVEASDYNHRMFMSGIYRSEYRYHKGTQVDRRKLSSDERMDHQRKIEIQGKILGAINEEIRKNMPINIDNYPSVLPKLFRFKDDLDNLHNTECAPVE